MNKLEQIYNANRLDFFAMAVSHLLDIGFRAAEKVTEEDIEKMEGNALMTKSFVQQLMRLSKEIAEACDHPTRLIQFCQKHEIFESGDIKREKLKRMFCYYVENDYDASSPEYVRDALEQAGCDEEYWDEIGLGWLKTEEENEYDS